MDKYVRPLPKKIRPTLSPGKKTTKKKQQQKTWFFSRGGGGSLADSSILQTNGEVQENTVLILWIYRQTYKNWLHKKK